MHYSLLKISYFTLILVAITIPFCVWAVVHIPMGSAGIHEWLPEGRPERQRYERFVEQFGNDQIIIVSWEQCFLGDERMLTFRERLVDLDESSQNHLPVPRLPYFSSIESTETLLKKLRAPPLSLSRSDSINRLQGFMIGKDGTGAVLIRVSDFGVANQDATVSLVFEAADRTPGLDRSKIIIAGTVYEAYAVDQAAEASLKRLVLPSSLLGLIVAWLCLRSFRKAVMVLALAGVGQMLAIGMVYYTGNRFSAVLVVLPTLVFMLTLSGAIHLVNYFTKCQQKGLAYPGSQALLIGWVPSTLSSVTTIIGMGSLGTSELYPVRQFGVFCAVGLAVATVVLLLSFPAATDLVFRRRTKENRSSVSPSKDVSVFLPKTMSVPSFSPPSRIESYVRAIGINASWISGVSIAVLVAMFFGLGWLHASSKFTDMFPESSKTNRDMHWLEMHLGPIATVEVLLKFAKECELNNFDRIRILSKISGRLREEKRVGGVLSAVNFVPSWSESGTIAAVSKRGALRRAIDNTMPDLIASRMIVEADGVQTWRLMAKVSAVDSDDYGTLSRMVSTATREAMKEITDASISVEFTGLSPVMHETQTMLLKDLGYSFVMAFALITPVMIWITRSFLGGVVLMLPNVLPVTIAFGMMGWLKIDLDIAGILTASIAFGIAVDDTLHFVCRYIEGLNRNLSKEDAIVDTIQSCGKAMIHTTLISCVSMAPFLLAEFLPTQQFAELMIVMLSIAIIGDLILLPALLLSPLGSFIRASKTRQDLEVF